MIDLRPYSKLGRFDNEWLNARYHFSFSGYHDPRRMGQGPLLVWNNDRIRAGTGFDPHPHRDMEIITYVMKGAISHQDSLGNKGKTGAGQIQVMSAGTGIVHAEHNLEDEETELFQIWIAPDRQGVKPRWETLEFPASERSRKLQPLASGRKGDEKAIPLYQDAAVYAATLEPGESVVHRMGNDRQAYLVLARGSAEVNGTKLGARDGAAVSGEEALTIKADEQTEIVLVDVPAGPSWRG
ncbi:MAG: pirin family protein [Reyranellaceae bacterium]